MKVKPSQRTEKIRYAIREIAAEAAKEEKTGKKLIYLNIGDPAKYGWRFPSCLFAAVKKNVVKSAAYANSLGEETARQSIVSDWKKQGVTNLKPDDIIVGQGISELVIFTLGALLDPKDNILLPSPGYPLYNNTVHFFNGQVKTYRLIEEEQWQPDLEQLEKRIDKRTKAIVVINPSNPTGQLIKQEKLRGIIRIAKKHKLLIISDETYGKLAFKKNSFVSLAKICSDHPIMVFNSLSKSHMVPGWRVGWATLSGPKKSLLKYKEAIQKLVRTRLSAVHPFQYAIISALESSNKHLPPAIAALKKRAHYATKRLNQIKGISAQMPEAAFFIYATINLPIKSDLQFVRDLIKAGVVLVPGSG
ncbi:aminotransferase class I/II-fold pyridoxal phosphate-dependent enzyme, partial [Patescibacteria group bacterium]|nr:aminotransferase class I/II-fold pyridoxal phosphate-dependent enzyme [Patescibacteria group bacterium]